VARGELQLSVLSLLGPHLNPENAAELFEACVRKSCEQVELLLAARFPRPDVREAIRRLPTRSEVLTPDGAQDWSYLGKTRQPRPLALPLAVRRGVAAVTVLRGKRPMRGVERETHALLSGVERRRTC
jgi:hypothetical protein